MGMRGAQHDVHNVGKLRHHMRKSVEHMLNPLVRRKQAERQQHLPAAHAELVLVEIRGNEWYIGNAVRDEIDFGRRRPVHLFEDLSSPAPSSPPIASRRASNSCITRCWSAFGLEENGVKRSHHRRPQFSEQRQQMAAGRPPENSEFVLDRNNVRRCSRSGSARPDGKN